MKLFKANSDKIHNILLSIKLTLGTLGATAFANDHATLAFSLLIAAGITDIVLSAFSSKEA